MTAPMPFRKFHELLKEHGCTYERRGKASHYFIFDADGNFVSDFSVTHGKNTKGDEVKPFYVKQFTKAIAGDD